MAADEPIRPEASTIHRLPEAVGGDPVQGSPGDGDVRGNGDPAGADSTDLVATDEQQLVQAETVIRGSSRALSGAGRDGIDRTPATVAKVLLGQRLNHFYLEELIGGGGMGAVFRARDEQLDRVVAIKVIPFVGDDPDLQRRFRNEAQSAAKLDHPRIARVFDVGSHDEWHYIVFEYIRGTNIRDMVLGSGVLTIDDAVFYTCQLAEAIQHASDRGIVHRDIKPSNVLIGDEDTIKLVDMGLARSEHYELSEDMTASGVTLGTFDYISPEQARDPRDADLRSDIYSLGCTLYFMLTGRPPYPGGTMLQKLLSHGNAPPPDARTLRPQVSDELMAVIEKMLAKSPQDRYQSASDLIADLREVAFRDGLKRAQAIGPISVVAPNPVLDWMERHAPWLVAVTLLIVTAGWLHLDAVASREDWQVPPTAVTPEPSARLGSSQETGAAAIDTDRAASDSANPQEGPANRPTIAAVPPTFTGPPDDSGSAAVAADRTARGDMIRGDGTGDEAVGQNDATAAGQATGADSVPGEEPLLPAMSVDPVEALEPPHLIRVVGSDVPLEYDRDVDGAALAATFSDALELADLYQLDHVELSAPVLYSEPIEITRDNLRITSDVAGGSTVIFQTEVSIAMERSNVIAIGANRIEIEDIHFVWKVPSGEIDGGALFAVNDNPLVRLTDCSITVDNPTMCDAVYAFEVVTDPDQMSRSRRSENASRDEAGLPLVAIELNNVIIRGEIGMIHMDYAAELQLNWENGLLAISEPMIDTAGALVPIASTARPIQLWLTRVTAHSQKGLLQMRVGVSGAYPVPVDRFAQSSVFVVDDGLPHFEFSGLESITSDSPLLQLRGASNAYDTDPTLANPVLVLSTSADETEMTRFNSLASRWPDEVSPRWSVYWSAVRLSDAPPSRRQPSDYRQDGAVRSGFDEKLLPILPDLEASSLGNRLELGSGRANLVEREL